MTSEGGNSEFGALERLIELNEGLPEKVKNLKQLVVEQNERFTEEIKNLKRLMAEQNKRLTKEVQNLKQLVADLYLATTSGQTALPMPTSLSGLAPNVVHQAHGPPTTVEDSQYSPDSPRYYNESKVAGSSTMCPLAPPFPLAPPSATAPQFTVLARLESLRNETERERDPRKWSKGEFKQPHSFSRTPQKHHQHHHFPHDRKYSTHPLHKVQPYAPTSSYPQWRSLAIQTTYNTPHNHFQTSPNLPFRKQKNLCSRPSACHKKLRRRGMMRFTPIEESCTNLFEKLQQANMLKPISGNMNPTGKVDRSRRCAFHYGVPGHDIENCWDLKKEIEALIDNNQIKVVWDETQHVNQILLPVHNVPNDTGMVGTVFIKEDLKGNETKQIVAVDPSPDTRRHESSIVVSVDGPNASTINGTRQDVVIEPIQCTTRSFISPKEVKSTLMGLGENEEKKKILPDSGNFFGISMANLGEGLNNA